MRVRAPFVMGSAYVGTREIYFTNHMSPELSEEIGNILLRGVGYERVCESKPAESKPVAPIVITTETDTSLPAEVSDVSSVVNEYFNERNKTFLKDNKYFRVYEKYFTFTIAENRDDIDVSIIVPTRNRFEDLKKCILSIYEHTHDLTYEIIVVDGSNGEHRKKVLNAFAEHAPIFLVKELVGDGTISAFNKGFIQAQGEYTVWLNDDSFVEKDWLNIAYDFMESRKDVGLGAIYHKEGALAFGKAKPHTGYIWDGDYCVRTLHQFSKHPGFPYANFGIIKTKLFKELGFWDEKNYKSYVADTDLAHRVFEYGLKVEPIKGSRVVHLYKIDDLRKENNEAYISEREFYESIWCKR